MSASEESLRSHSTVIVSWPLRCTNWIYFRQLFERMDITCRCIGLTADIAAISARERTLSAGEIARSTEMIDQGYGQRSFNEFTVRTDEVDFDETCCRLMKRIQQTLDGT